MDNSKKAGAARNIAMVALGTALIAAGAWISIPFAIPFTMQTFAVLTVAAVLGLRSGVAAVAVYIALGAAGAPVFSGFSGGVSILFGATGGYIAGFLLTAAVVGIASGRFGTKLFPMILSMSLGVLLCYAVGTIWFVHIFTGTTYQVALLKCVVPYLLPDAAKIALAAFLVPKIRRALRRKAQ